MKALWTLFFSADDVVDWASASRCDAGRYGRFFHEMLRRGVFLAPSQFEANFISMAHTDADIDETVHAVGEALALVWAGPGVVAPAPVSRAE